MRKFHYPNGELDYLHPVPRLHQLVDISSGMPVSVSRDELQERGDYAEVPDGASLYLTGADFDADGFLLPNGGRIAWLSQRDRERYAVRPDDVLFQVTGYGIRACRPPVDVDYAIIPNNNFVRLRPTTSEILPGYLFAYLNSATAKRFGESRLIGDVLPNLTKGDLGQMPVTLPSMREQTLIARLADLRRRAATLITSLQADYAALARGGLAQTLDSLL